MAGILRGTFAGEVLIDNAELQRVLTGTGGPVVDALMVAGQIVKQGAQRRVGVWRQDPADPLPPRRGGRRGGTLRDSIVTRLVTGGAEGVMVLVGSEDPIALIHHEGTEPHPIHARRKPFLVFYWPKTARVMRLRSVNHPGTQPNRYLTDSLADLKGTFPA